MKTTHHIRPSKHGPVRIDVHQTGGPELDVEFEVMDMEDYSKKLGFNIEHSKGTLPFWPILILIPAMLIFAFMSGWSAFEIFNPPYFLYPFIP